MCGITGIYDSHGICDTDQYCITAMTRILQHRGPDDEGYFKDDNVLLGQRRLSIIDISSGKQPISNEDGTIWIVYNGEIFNYIELMDDLKKRGHIFSTRCDTEVIVHLYEEYGTGLFSHLNGQFSIAIWDSNRHSLLLARDRVGILPLFYTTTSSGKFLFASEMKSFFCHNELKPEIDPSGLHQIFTFWANIPPRTVFKGIQELPAGCFMQLSPDGEHKVCRYWNFSFPAKGDYEHKPLQHYKDELKSILHDAVALRLRADVPVAAYLSGGIDSSIISALVKKYHNNNLITFSVAFHDNHFDERAYQQEMVKHLQTDHRMIEVDYQSIGSAFSDTIWFTEKPMIRTAPAPLFLLSKLVRDNGIKVVLTGEGSDEFLGGYDIFKENAIRRFWARQPHSKVRPLLFSRIYPDIKGSGTINPFWLQFFGKQLQNTDNPYYSHLIRWNNTAYIQNFLNSQLKNHSIDFDSLDNFCDPSLLKWHPLCSAQYLEIMIFLSGYLMSSQGDRMLMGNSVEGRFPFLDHRLFEFASTIPPEYKMMGLTEKYLLKQTFSDLVPQNIIKRAKKPYRAPIEQCFLQQNLASNLISDEIIRKYGYFDNNIVYKLTQKMRNEKMSL
ncbi:MAG TPA: asparagine synthase (glutamine-hydrolyzing), partial [Chitinispirillaceae bacterium]|nr:asparagine synthase (glutamine-hydrolyzing) [Chitinispirillaceae bacterium]